MIQIKNYIEGQLLDPVSNNWLDNYEPATGKVYSQIPDSGAADVEAAVKAAEKAFDSWSKASAAFRAEIMLKIASGINDRLEELAKAESTDNGKPISLARSVDIPRARDNFHFFATGIIHFASESHGAKSEYINYTLRQPIGVVGCISPWNLPLYLFTWKIAPALAAGNCVIAKPSEVTPMTAFLLSEICKEAGLPEGVLNIIHGLGPAVGAAMVEHPKVKAISFTGGTTTGAGIAKIAAPMFKKLSLELGGKNPNIIFADCDFEEMMDTTVRSSFANQGQICLCGSRIFVERPIYDRFKKEFIARVEALNQGDPALEITQQGAVVSEMHFRKVLSYIKLAKEEGGTILTGGKSVSVSGRCEQGWFIAPTVIEGLAFNCRTNTEEIFGPVTTIMPFDTEEEVLEYANVVDYGLACTLWTSNLKRAHNMAEKVQAGIVWINCWLLRDLRTPFGGMKASGVGREGGWEALRFFTEAKNVCVKY
ncbi:MAG: aminomuconate-semialdehyde/2-hydroxymuconate-6-semialdehyde dehydrogenase [Limisphaerales bacterium]|jgi:aminomuconate-semialdehyde/2-hydroxymuconate-6-semialdehyde dehydrogenase